jgi:hypothetical protein
VEKPRAIFANSLIFNEKIFLTSVAKTRQHGTKTGTSGAFSIHTNTLKKENKIIFEKKIHTRVE